MLFTLGLEDVEDYRYSVFVIVTDYSLICVRGIRFDDATLFLGRLRWLMVLQEERFWVEDRRVLPE